MATYKAEDLNITREYKTHRSVAINSESLHQDIISLDALILLIGFSGGSMVKNMKMKKIIATSLSTVLLASTFHSVNAIDKTTNEKTPPEHSANVNSIDGADEQKSRLSQVMSLPLKSLKAARVLLT